MVVVDKIWKCRDEYSDSQYVQEYSCIHDNFLSIHRFLLYKETAVFVFDIPKQEKIIQTTTS